MKVVQDRLGHSSMTMTSDVYSHVLLEVAAEAVQLVASMLDAAIPVLADGEHASDAAAGPDAARAENAQVSPGRPPGARTLNQRIKSPLLCQLS